MYTHLIIYIGEADSLRSYHNI